LDLFNSVCWENGALRTCSYVICCASIISWVHSPAISSIRICRGEWHTYPDYGLISTSTMETVASWYNAAFQTIRMQVCSPLDSAYAAGMGFHDDSFAYSTLDGAANGNVVVDWFFYPRLQAAGYTDFWKRGVMGGETRPAIQATVFSPDYPAGTEYHQDFMECVNTTHATYMVNFAAFADSGYSGTTLDNARHAHARMGYNFQVTNVAVASKSRGSVTVDVTVRQTGVAPFYYPLSLDLSCPKRHQQVGGVDGLVQNGDSKVFSFAGIPAHSSCLNAIKITLESDFVRAGRPVKFAQGKHGSVLLSLPLPP
jgi:hypothetical protein